MIRSTYFKTFLNATSPISRKAPVARTSAVSMGRMVAPFITQCSGSTSSSTRLPKACNRLSSHPGLGDKLKEAGALSVTVWKTRLSIESTIATA